MIYGALTLTRPLSLTSRHVSQDTNLWCVDWSWFFTTRCVAHLGGRVFYPHVNDAPEQTCRYTEGDAGTVWKEQKHSAKSGLPVLTFPPLSALTWWCSLSGDTYGSGEYYTSCEARLGKLGRLEARLIILSSLNLTFIPTLNRLI